MPTLAEGQAVTYCATDILWPDRPPEAAEHAKHSCRLKVARELAASLADGDYYTIRLVESEEPENPTDWWAHGPEPVVRFVVRADIRRVEMFHVRMMVPPDPYESMTMPVLARTAGGELVRRVRDRLVRSWRRA